MSKHIFNKQAHYNLQTQIRGLLNTLQQLAPHPEQSNMHAPLSLQSHAIFKPVGENDGMLGSFMIESLLGCAFLQAANDTPGSSALTMTLGMNLDQIAEAASEYISERTPDHKRGRGTIALGEHKVIAPDFNNGAKDAAMDLFMQDLPARHRIEGHIAALVQELDDMEHTVQDMPALMAA